MLLKSIPAEIKDLDVTGRVVTAYWSAFGNMDSDGDIIERGSYTKTISERGPGSARPRIKVLWQHDWWTPIGIPTDLIEDDHGLLATSKISSTQAGRDALILYEDGVITEHSVGLDIIERREEDKARITQIRLWEGSPVTWGANMLTPVVELRSASDANPIRKRLNEQAKRAAKALEKGISDELAIQLSGWLEIVSFQMVALESIEKAHEAEKSIQAGTAQEREVSAIRTQLTAAIKDLDALGKDRPDESTDQTEPDDSTSDEPQGKGVDGLLFALDSLNSKLRKAS